MKTFKKLLSALLALMMLLSTPLCELVVSPVSAAEITPTGIAGDITGDGKISITDVLRMAKYMSGWSVDLDSNALDTNGDGKINITDVLRLAKFVAGWDIELNYGVSDLPDPVEGSEGLSYTLSSDGSYYIASGLGTCTDADVVIGNTYNGMPVREIGEKAFAQSYSVYSFTIPDGITTIGANAFRMCTGITEITLPESIKGIGEYAFFGCNSLTKVTFTEGIEYIGQYVFYNCDSITDIIIPSTVTDIHPKAFRLCDNIENIEIAEGGVLRFVNNCIINSKTGVLLLGMYDATIPDDGSVKAIGDYAFNNNTVISNIVIPEGVVSIGASAFAECSALRTITLPCSVTSIGASAFESCNYANNLTYAGSEAAWEAIEKGTDWDKKLGMSLGGYALVFLDYVPDVLNEGASIGVKYTLSDDGSYYIASGVGTCTDSKLVIATTCNGLPVKEIGESAFEREYFTEVIIPEGVTTVGKNAFYYITSLNYVTLPESIEFIDTGAFAHCAYVYTVTYAGARSQWNAIEKAEGWDEGLGSTVGNDGQIICLGGEDVTEPEPEFSEGLKFTIDTTGSYYILTGTGSCKDEIVKIPSTYNDLPVKEIAARAFDYSSITGVVIPESVTAIRAQAFYSCTALTSVSVSTGLETLEEGAFYNCVNLEAIEVDPANPNFYSYGNCMIKTATQTVVLGSKNSVLPDGIMAIGNDVFNGFRTLTSINLPDGLKYIGARAFSYCTSLTGLVIPESVVSIGEGAFKQCTHLTVLTYLGNELQWANIAKGSGWDESLGFIEGGYTVNCMGYLPEIPVELEYAVSEDGTYLTVIGLGNHTDRVLNVPTTYGGTPVKAIGEYAFANADLTTVIIPEGVTSIGYGAFNGCMDLEAVVIPTTVAAIDSYAFFACSDALRIYYRGTPAQWDALYSTLSDENKNALDADVFFYSITEPNNTANSYWHMVNDLPEMYYPYSWIAENEWETMWRLVKKNSVRRIINEIIVGIQNLEEQIIVYDIDIPNEELFSFCEEVLPGLAPKYCYFTSNGSSYGYTESGGVLAVYPNYYVSTQAEAQAMMNELDAKVNEVLAGVPVGASEYEKIEYIHDWIVKNSVPDLNNYESNDGRGIHAGSAYGCIIDGEPVCLGYCKALAYMLGKLDIEVTYELGSHNGTGHIWSKVKCDGEWYNIDAIWNDPCGGFQTDDPDYVSYDYYMVTDAVITGSRDVDMNKYFSDPYCDAVENNWYVRNGAYITGSGMGISGIIGQQMNAANAAGDAFVYGRIKFATEELYNEYMDDFKSNVQLIFDQLNFAAMSISYIDSPDTLSITFRITPSSTYALTTLGGNMEYEIIEIPNPIR